MALARNLALSLMVLATPALAAEPAATPAAAPAPTKSADDWPNGAPREDYPFTAWCYGVLKRHMELYNDVKPELEAISKRWKTEEEDRKEYAEQLAAGKVALSDFARAIEAAERASPRPINAQGAAAIEQGRRMWAEFATVDKTWQAYSWMNWELPEKCIKVSSALEKKSILMSPALRSSAVKVEPSKPAEAKTEVAAKPADPVGDLIGPAMPDADAKPDRVRPGVTRR